MVKLVPGRREVGPTDNLGEVDRRLVYVDDAQRIGALGFTVEGDDVGQLLARRDDRVSRSAVERRIGWL